MTMLNDILKDVGIASLTEFEQEIEKCDLPTLLNARLILKELEDEIEPLKDAVGARMVTEIIVSGDTTDTGTPVFRLPKVGSATVQTKKTVSINRTKLIARGVDPDVIDDCTDRHESAPFVVCVKAKPKE